MSHNKILWNISTSLNFWRNIAIFSDIFSCQEAILSTPAVGQSVAQSVSQSVSKQLWHSWVYLKSDIIQILKDSKTFLFTTLLMKDEKGGNITIAEYWFWSTSKQLSGLFLTSLDRSPGRINRLLPLMLMTELIYCYWTNTD